MKSTRDTDKASALASPRHQASTDRRPATPAIVKTARGIALNVQAGYAQWHDGMRRLPKLG